MNQVRPDPLLGSTLVALVFVLVLGSTALLIAPARGAPPADSAPADARSADKAAAVPPAQAGHAAMPDADTLFSAVVRVNTKATPGARSIETLGAEREGSGILIGPDGLVLTIGYLIVEADQVTITDRSGKGRPARVIGYDHATGFGLLRGLTALEGTPLELGDSDRLAEREPVMIVNHLGRGESSLAYVVSRREFTGNWEYLIERAIFTSPPSLNWSGAALVGKEGSLLGVGSLIVREVARDVQVPGNMFVPVALLKPILADLLRQGRRAGPARPWLGVAADEVQGHLFVTRVSPDGPADRAGVRPGDIVLGVGGNAVRTQAELYRKVWGRGAAGVEIPMRVLQGTEIRDVVVQSIDRTEYFRPKRTF